MDIEEFLDYERKLLKGNFMDLFNINIRDIISYETNNKEKERGK